MDKAHQANACHEKAMHLCDVGDLLVRFGKFNLATKMFRRAHILEKHAARIALKLDCIRSAGILEKSAEEIRLNIRTTKKGGSGFLPV